jgi:hypothetical protein
MQAGERWWVGTLEVPLCEIKSNCWPFYALARSSQCELLLRPTLINIGLVADGGVNSRGWLAAESPPPPPVLAMRNALVRNKSSLLAFLCPLM